MREEDKKWFRVCLRLYGDSLDPHSVTGLLGITADKIGIKGVPRTGKNNRTYAPYRTNIWIYRSKLHHEVGFEEQISSIFEALGDKVELLSDILETPGVDGELFCGFGSGNGQGGDDIAPATLRQIADAGLSFSLDLYPPGLPDNEEAELAGTGQPATRPELKSEGSDQPQPEAEGRSR